MSKWLKIPLWIAVSLTVLGVSLRYALTSDVVLRNVLSFALSKAPNYLNGEVKASSLTGDLLSDFTATDLSLSSQGDTVFSVDKIRLKYSFWELLNRKLEIKQVLFQRPHFHIVEHADSTLNITSLLKESNEDVDENTSGIGFAILVQQLSLLDGQVSYTSFTSPERLNTTISQLNVGLSAEYSDERTFLSLQKLGFALKNPLLPTPLDFGGSGSTDGKTFTLDSLSISDGISLFNLAADYGIADSSLKTQLSSSNFGLESLPDSLLSIDENQRFSLKLDLSLQGAKAEVGIGISTKFLEQLDLNISANLDSKSVQNVVLNGAGWDLPNLLKNDDLPKISKIEFKGDGDVFWENLENSMWNSVLSVQEIRHRELNNPLPEISFSSTIDQGKLDAVVKMNSKHGKVNSSVYSNDVFAHSDSLEWKFGISINALVPSHFRSEFIASDVINAKIDADGKGYNPNTMKTNISILADHIKFNNQQFRKVDAEFSYAGERIDYEFGVQLKKSEFFSDGFVELSASKKFGIVVQTDKFNIAEVYGFDSFPTQIFGSAQISGTGFTLEELSAKAQINLTKSLVNGELIDDFSGYMYIDDQILTVQDGSLLSTLAEAKFEGRRNLQDKLDSDNYLSLDAQIDDLRSLAPLFGVENFQVKGNVKGTVFEEADGLKARFETKLNSIVFDDIRIDEITGNVSGVSYPQPSVEASLKVSGISQDVYALQEVVLSLSGVKPDSLFFGNFSAHILARNDSKINLAGSIDLKKQHKEIELTTASFTGVKRELHLKAPVHILAKNTGSISMSSLDLRYDKNVFIHIDTLHYSKDHTLISMQAKQLSLEIIQTLFGSQAHIDGWLDLNLMADISREKEYSVSKINLYNLTYDRFKVDSVQVLANLSNEILVASYHVATQKQRISQGFIKLPFSKFNVPKGAKEEGFLSVNLPDFEIIKPLLDDLGINDISGGFQSEVIIAGSLDKPEIEGFAKLTTPTFAGILLDSLRLNFSYNHDEERADIFGTADLGALRLAEISGFFPFHYQPTTLSVELPSPSDSVGLKIYSKDFDLGFFQPFMAPVGIGKFGGKFSADINLSGRIDELKADGGATVRALEADYLAQRLKFKEGEIDVLFTNDRIHLKKAEIKSGRGKLQSNGFIDIKNLQPTAYQIVVKGNQFAVSQRKDLMASIGTDLILSGPAAVPTLRGTITLNDAEVWLPDFGIKTVESVVLEQNESDNISMFDSLTMDIKLIIPETLPGSAQKVLVRKKSTPEINLIMGGNVRIGKKRGGEIQLFGPVGARSGYVRELGKKFELLKGEVAFTGEPDDPILSFETLYEIPRDDIKIYFRISGSLQTPEFTYESEPPMETQDIVSYVLFGRPFAALAGWQSTVANANSGDSNELKDKATELLLNKASEVAADKLGLDVVEIDDSNQTTGAGMTIKAGKYLNEKILVAVIQQMGTNSTTQFTLEYQLRKNLQFIFTQSEDNRTGVDILWRYEY